MRRDCRVATLVSTPRLLDELLQDSHFGTSPAHAAIDTNSRPAIVSRVRERTAKTRAFLVGSGILVASGVFGVIFAACLSTSDECIQPVGIQLTCVDATTGAAIADATATCVGNGAEVQLAVGCTNPTGDGSFSQCVYVGPVDPGTYRISFMASGYEDQSLSVTLTADGSCGRVLGGRQQVSLVPIRISDSGIPSQDAGA